ncbi:MAG: MoaD/ThiS family protein [Desulfurococcales archaeon]|nr:MoaD/ThiS family protein [Desulfurococcales archaeon]
MRIKFYGALKHEIGIDEVEIEGQVETLREAVNRIVEKLGDRASKALLSEKGDLRTGLLVLINGTPASLMGGLDAKLRRGDEVVLDRIEMIEVEGGGL